MHDATVLMLPGWLGCGPEDWQMHWARQHGAILVEQDDWRRPRRGDWLARLDEVVIDTPGDLFLVAQGLGCILVAAWAAFSLHTARVRGALLVAPIDVASHDMKNKLPGWAPVLRAPLPFASTVVGPVSDPPDLAQSLALAWGSKWHESVQVAPLGADSYTNGWPQGRTLLQT
jgi:predicted alpha/beta hydrolase family esterase